MIYINSEKTNNHFDINHLIKIKQTNRFLLVLLILEDITICKLPSFQHY